MIDRIRYEAQVREVFRTHAVCALLGPRQCGKTTLARHLAEDEPTTFFDLEDPVDLRRLDAPRIALEGLSGLVVLDEIQRRPGLFELLRVLVDRPENAARFLVLSSASLDLVRGVSESLAGRIGFVDLSPFGLDEVGSEAGSRLWLRGGFPRSFLAEDEAASAAWREGFVRTFLERDIPQLGITVPAETLRRFWTMIAHFHAGVWNAAQFARALGASESTARRYLDILAGAYMVRVLPPWFENTRKRQVKSPKVYLRDPGLLHALLGIRDRESLDGHPKRGASWEGFALDQVIQGLATRDAYFWGTHGGAELDLLVHVATRRYGFEFKLADAPGTTRSMRIALEDLRLEHLWVVYPGREPYELDEKISVTPLSGLPELCRALRAG
ncbi:MAG: ATP-binding protein [Gemmatimonadota bacterium]